MNVHVVASESSGTSCNVHELHFVGCKKSVAHITIESYTYLYADANVKLSLAHGQWYYVTVRGCSLYSGCSAAHSDGIRVDVTPPITSQLSHGLPSAPLAQFQASR